ncbi:MAG: hypothetical protein ACTHK7_15745 [Aureliella sp.]
MKLFLLIPACLVACLSTLRAADPRPAYEMLPQSVQAVVWIPDSDTIVERWNRTQLAKLAEDPSIKDFWESQREQIELKLTTAGWRLQIQPRDLGEIVQGQLALAWIERHEDTSKPFALALIVDVVNKAPQTEQFLEKLNAQLKERGAEFKQLSHNGAEITQNTLPRQSGELLPQETFYTVVNEQLIASDDLQTLKDLIDASSAEKTSGKLNADPVFTEARSQLKVSDEGQIEYFVRPLGFARVIRAISGKRSRGKADVLAVLQNQGFEAIKAVSGEFQLGQEKFDILHRGFVLADEKRPPSVQVLDFPNDVPKTVPAWVTDHVSTLLATCWNVKDAFWKVEGLVDEMAGQPEVFREIINGIKDDPNGPRIDIAKEVMPLLTNDIYSVSDTKEPIDIDSRRNLIAIRVKQPEQMLKVLSKAMEKEPDAEELAISGQKVWQVVHKEEDLALDADFGDFAKPAPGGAAQEAQQPWLSNWAITVNGEYLMFASHVDMITEAINQAKQVEKSPLTDEKDYQRVVAALTELFDNEPACAWQINRSKLAYRAQYELFRAGKLQESQSMLAHLLEHVLQSKSEMQQRKKPAVDGSKLPPFEAVSKYLQPSGMMVQTTEKGWSFGGVLLSQVGDTQATGTTTDSQQSAGAGASNAANKPVRGATQR